MHFSWRLLSHIYSSKFKTTSTDLDVLYEIPLPSIMMREDHIEMDDDLYIMGVSSDEKLIQHAKRENCENIAV